MKASAAVKASVLMITYEHAKYVGQAIDSALMQHTAFPFELVVADDCSTDGTREIIEAYARRHPGVVRPLWADRNLGMVPNFARCWEACRGEFIAVLEGDDYWTSPDKLQRQVDAMERHREWAMCFQRVRVVYEDGRPPAELPSGPQKPVFTLRDLLAGNPIQTCGVIYRAGVVPALPASFAGLALGDWPLAILHALRGDIGFLDEVMSVYRRHAGGAWSPRPVEWQNAAIDRMFEVVRPLVTRALGSREAMWAHDALWAGDYMADGLVKLARRHARHCVRARPLRPYSWRLLLWSHLGRLGRELDPRRGRALAAARPRAPGT